jgi:LmbE family N-acetylglucosaminyl deacetylase
MPTKIAMAIGAHPDDIEFMMAGTLVLLKRVGYETHYMNVASGSCGSSRYSAARLRAMRCAEAKAACDVLGAQFHTSLVDDFEIYYERRTLRGLAAVVREVNPMILLVPSPQDYMEDHTNACRLAVSAAFTRGMPNFSTQPRRSAVQGEVTVYHAMPHGLRDPLRRRVMPGLFVDTGSVHSIKIEALARHRSQQDWLGASQKMSHYVATMESFSRDVGRMSGRFEHAEGWRRHLHYGFCSETAVPLQVSLGTVCMVNKHYEDDLENMQKASPHE